LEKYLFMKHIWILFVIAALVLTACGAAPEPTMSPADVQGTAMAAAMTMVADTQAAIPTATSLPPTEPPTETPFPTNTVPPLSLETPTLAQAISFPPTLTPVPASGSASGDPCNQPLTSWGGESAKLTLKNNTKPRGTVTASLFFNASFGECGYISAQFDSSTTLTVPVGTFSAGAFVDGPKDFKIFGGGTITRSANYSLWFENESIILKAGCSPNC
jgi:hypothetical protein